MSDVTRTLPRLSRRRLLQQSACAAALLGVPGLARTQEQLPRWSLDIDGDGIIGADDRRLIVAARPAARGARLQPSRLWEADLDFLGQGHTGAEQLATFDRLRPALGTALPPRPITACWHYGWYGRGRRRRETPTVRFLGGDYMSSDHRTEAVFNDLKREFGIDADILSWLDNRRVLRNYETGYLRASNTSQRLLGLLYESGINLGVEGRIDLRGNSPHKDKLVDDFRRMGEWLKQATADGGPRALRLDGRPVVYVFGSHTYGLRDQDLPAVGAALTQARAAFAEAYGAAPWLIGDESIFPGDRSVELNRRFRASYFDAVTRYHHYDERLIRELGDGADVRMDAAYRSRIVELEERNIEGFGRIRNQFTDAPVVVIPSAAAGFAKRRLPALTASREDYADLIDAMQSLSDAHLQNRHRARLHTAALPAPLVLLGSWNEEFEGHALLPAARNTALLNRRQDGYDWLYAVKARYGSSRPRGG